jgi:predicted HicB family RNase H-like nuclease
MNERHIFSYKSFDGSVEVSAEDGCLFGQILFIRDTVIYHAQTVPELKKAFEEAVDQYVADCVDIGREPNKPLSGSFNIRIGSARHRELSTYAFKKGISINGAINHCVDLLLETASVVETLGVMSYTAQFNKESKQKWITTDTPKLRVVK